MDAEAMGKRIAQLRKARNLTQQQLADQLNVTNRAISRWERGEGYPEITLLPKLADSLGVTTDEILGHRTGKQPGMRFAQQPQVIIGIGLVLIFAVEIARRLQPQQSQLLALTGLTLLVILGLIIVMLREKVTTRVALFPALSVTVIVMLCSPAASAANCAAVRPKV